jgi:hypothetical protein
MAKPTDLPRWAETAGGTPAANIIEPSSGKKDLGFSTIAESPGGKGDVPTSGGLNWFMRLAYKWCEWLDGLQGEELTWAENQVFSKLLQLSGGALQSILKGGTGGLDIGTSIASDLRVLLNNVAEWTFRESDGALVSNGKQITGLPTPVAASDGANKAYIDGGGRSLSSSCGAYSTTGDTSEHDVTNLSRSFTTNGRPVFIALQADGSTNECSIGFSDGGWLYLYRNTTLIARWYVATSGLDSPGGFFIVDAPVAGTYTYKITCKNYSAGAIIHINYAVLAVVQI